MKRETKKRCCAAAALLAAFALWTSAVCCVDVQPVGPEGSCVGFATVNSWFHSLTGVHMPLYVLTDWLSLVPLGCAMGFALLGLIQWIQRKHILKVDRSILALGGFYLAVMAAYLLFENIVVNFRPVLIEGFLEASYPSSTTLLVLCIMPTAAMQLNARIKNKTIRWCAVAAITFFTVFIVLGRLVSGVHWITDIIGGALLSAALVALYAAAAGDE